MSSAAERAAERAAKRAERELQLAKTRNRGQAKLAAASARLDAKASSASAKMDSKISAASARTSAKAAEASARLSEKAAAASAKLDAKARAASAKLDAKIREASAKASGARRQSKDEMERRGQAALNEAEKKIEAIEQKFAAGEISEEEADAQEEAVHQEAKQKVNAAAKEILGNTADEINEDGTPAEGAPAEDANSVSKKIEAAEDDICNAADAGEAKVTEAVEDIAGKDAEGGEPEQKGSFDEAVEEDSEPKMDAVEAAIEGLDNATSTEEADLARAGEQAEEAVDILLGWVDIGEAVGDQSIYLNVKYDDTGAPLAQIAKVPIAPNGAEMENRKRKESYRVGTVANGEVVEQSMAGTFEVDARRSPTDDKSIDRVEPVGDANGEKVLEIKGWQAQDSESPDTLADTLSNGGTFEGQQVLVRSGKNGVLTYLPIGVLGGGGDSSEDPSGQSDPVAISVKYENHTLYYQEGTVNLATGVVTPGAWKEVTVATPCDCGGGGDSSEEPGGTVVPDDVSIEFIASGTNEGKLQIKGFETGTPMDSWTIADYLQGLEILHGSLLCRVQGTNGLPLFKYIPIAQLFSKQSISGNVNLSFMGDIRWDTTSHTLQKRIDSVNLRTGVVTQGNWQTITNGDTTPVSSIIPQSSS